MSSKHKLHKKVSPLRISSLNVTFQFPADLVTFTEQNLNGKINFLCYDSQSQDIPIINQYFKVLRYQALKLLSIANNAEKSDVFRYGWTFCVPSM